MKTDTQAYAQAELEQVAHCFDHWRQHRANRNTPIPQVLWQQAITLTTRLPLPHVAKHLGLKSTTLKQHCVAHHGRPPHEVRTRTEACLSFVEVSPPPPAWHHHMAPTEVELQRADGTRLRIHGPQPQLPLADLVRTFLETP